MSVENATKFLEVVASPTFEEEHADAVEPLYAAAKADDPDAAAALGAKKFHLHFSGAELKEAGAQVAAARKTLSAHHHEHRTRHAASLAWGEPWYGPGGGPTTGLPFAAGIALKVALKTMADQLKAQGKSPAEITAALEAYAGGLTGPDGRPLDLKKNITGVGVIDDIITNTVSVVAGTVQQAAQTSKTIIEKIFSGW